MKKCGREGKRKQLPCKSKKQQEARERSGQKKKASSNSKLEMRGKKASINGKQKRRRRSKRPKKEAAEIREQAAKAGKMSKKEASCKSKNQQKAREINTRKKKGSRKRKPDKRWNRKASCNSKKLEAIKEEEEEEESKKLESRKAGKQDILELVSKGDVSSYSLPACVPFWQGPPLPCLPPSLPSCFLCLFINFHPLRPPSPPPLLFPSSLGTAALLPPTLTPKPSGWLGFGLGTGLEQKRNKKKTRCFLPEVSFGAFWIILSDCLLWSGGKNIVNYRAFALFSI